MLAVISPALLMYLLPRDRLDGFVTFVARPIYPFAPLFSKFYDLSLAIKKSFTYTIHCPIHRWKFLSGNEGKYSQIYNTIFLPKRAFKFIMRFMLVYLFEWLQFPILIFLSHEVRFLFYWTCNFTSVTTLAIEIYFAKCLPYKLLYLKEIFFPKLSTFLQGFC